MIWTTKEGESLELGVITDSHLINIMKMMKRHFVRYDHDNFVEVGLEIVKRELLTVDEVFFNDPWNKRVDDKWEDYGNYRQQENQ
jgi:hypothetical protein